MSNPCLCAKPKDPHSCELCGTGICKNCEERLSEETFFYKSNLPKELKAHRYCADCYETHVLPAREVYEEILAKAKNVIVVAKGYRGKLHIAKTAKNPISIGNCKDKDDATLKLAYIAVEMGFSSLINFESKADRIQNHAYETTRWAVSALPADVKKPKWDEL